MTPEQLQKAVADGVAQGMKGQQGDSQRQTMQPGTVAAGADTVLGKAAGYVESAFSNTTPTIGAFSQKLQGLASDLGGEGLGAVVGSFGSILESNIGVFRELSSTGIDLGNSIMEAQLAAGRARLPLDVFAKRVQENAFNLATMYGSASQGAEKFADVSGMVMDKTGKKLATLGFTMDEISENTATYMEMMHRSGLAQRMSTEQLAAGASAYNLELDKLSKATGISRKQLDEANQAAARDLRMKLSLQELQAKDPAMYAAVNAKIEELKKVDPSGKLAAGFADMIAGGGVAITAEARNFTLAMNKAGVDASSMARNIYAGTPDAINQMNAGFTQAAAANKEQTEANRRLITTTMTLGRDTPLQYGAMLGQMGNSTKAAADAQLEQAKKIAAGEVDPTRAAAGLDQTLTVVQNSLKKSLIDSGVIDYTASGFNMAGKAAENLASEFSQLSNAGKLTAVLGPAIAGAVVEGLKTAGSLGLAGAAGGYAIKKGVDLYKGPGVDVETPDKKPGTPETPKPNTGPASGNKLMNMAKTGGKWIIIAGVAYWVADVVDATLGTDIVPTPFKKPEGERPLTIAEERERNAARVPDTATPPPKPVVIETPVIEPVLGAQQTQVNAVRDSLAESQRSAENLKTAVQNIDFSGLRLPDNISVSLENGSTKLKELHTNIVSTTQAFSDLNNVNLNTLSENLTKLNENMAKLSESAAKPFEPKMEVETPALAAKTTDTILSDLASKLDQLNSTMSVVASSQSEAVDYLSKTAKNTRNAIGNMLG